MKPNCFIAYGITRHDYRLIICGLCILLAALTVYAARLYEERAAREHRARVQFGRAVETLVSAHEKRHIKQRLAARELVIEARKEDRWETSL